MKRYFRELSVAAALGVMLLLLAIFAPNFFQPQPLLSRLTAAAPKLVLACGVALVIIARQIDISIGSLFAVSGTCAGLVAASGQFIEQRRQGEARVCGDRLHIGEVLQMGIEINRIEYAEALFADFGA